jgi:hypothetical protein
MNIEQFVSPETESTPHIIFDPKKNIYEMKGESRPENAKAFYDPLIEWIKNFCVYTIEKNDRSDKIIFNVYFDYFSSSSAKYLMNIFARLEELHNGNFPVEISWCYNEIDIEMKEAGEEFEKLLSIPFKFKLVTTTT